MLPMVNGSFWGGRNKNTAPVSTVGHLYSCQWYEKLKGPPLVDITSEHGEQVDVPLSVPFWEIRVRAVVFTLDSCHISTAGSSIRVISVG